MVIKSSNPRGAPGFLRKVHRALALREIYHAPGLSRLEVAEKLGLSAMAVGRIVRELEQSDLIIEQHAAEPHAGRGRPRTGLSLPAGGAYVVGAVISGFSQQIVVLNLLGNVVASEDVAFTDISNGPQCVREICAQIDELIEKTELPSERIVGVGFTCAAGIDSDQGVVTSGGYLGWQAFDFTELAEALLKRSVTLNNIADALLQAETFSGCARDQTAVVLVHCSTGLAASFSSNGELISGASHRAGRLGHFPAAATTLSCSCGGSSCLNCSASGWSALIDLGIVDSPVYQPEQVQTYAHEIARLIARSHANDDSATAPDGLSQSTINDVLLRTGQALGEQLCLLELTFDPDKLILAGTLASNNSFYEGVLTGLKHSGQFGTALAEKVSRSRLLPVTGAGISALLSTIFAPDLDLERLAGASTAAGDNNSDTK